MNARLLKLLLNIYPPYLGTGIVVKSISPDFRKAEVRMRLSWYNRNYVKTHFGGSLFAMTDPFHMLMLTHILGKKYRILDRSGRIEFIRPGTGTVSARFVVTDEMVETILAQTAGGEKYLPRFSVDIKDEQGETVARVEKELYIRKRQQAL